MKVLMISGDNQVVKNIDGPFSLTLNGLSEEWDQIDVLCPGVIGERQFNKKVRLFGVRKFFLPLDLFPFLMKNRYDLIVSHDYGLMLNGLNAFLASKVFNIPHISEIHHIEGFPQAVNLKESIYSFLGKMYVSTIGKFCRAIRIDNQGDILRLLTEKGISPNKIAYLPPIYLELDKYRPLDIAKSVDVLFVGRLVTNKGIFTILNAVLKLKSEGIKLKFKIKGRGPLELEIKRFINENKLQDSIKIDTKILNESKLIELYNESKILVCASTVEGGPRVTLEAMACNIPVISTPCGIMPEVIQEGLNGYLFDGTVEQLCLILKEILSNPSLLQKLSTNSRNSIEKYDYKITLKNYGLKYKNLITGASDA